jgi:hypothetical protein
MRDVMGFTADQMEAVNAGRPVARILPSRELQEVALAGAVRITGSLATLIQQFKTIETFEGRMGASAVGRFQVVPKLDDLRGLTFDPQDLASLQHCEPGTCELQLTAEAMQRFKTGVDWAAPGVADRANRLLQLTLFEMLGAYKTGGSAALGSYQDRAGPTSMGSEFQKLLVSRDLPADVPEFMHSVADYPRVTLRGAEDVFYWSKSSFGLRPTIRLSHMTIYALADPRPRRDGLRYVVATKQLYASRYFSSTLELRSLVDDYAKPGRGFFLFYTSKSRVNGLPGLLGAVVRNAVKTRARTAMEQYLDFTKRTIEK